MVSHCEIYAFDYVNCARTYSNYYGCRAGQFEIVSIQSRILKCHRGRGVGKLRVARHPFWFQFGLDVIVRIEIFHLARDAAFEVGGVEQSNRPDSTSSRQD